MKLEIWETRDPWIEVHEYSDCVRQKSGWMIFWYTDGGCLPNGSRVEISTHCLEGKFGGLPDSFVGFHPTRESAIAAVEAAGMVVNNGN